MHYLKDSPDPGSKPENQKPLKTKKQRQVKNTCTLFQVLEIVLGPAFRLH